MIGRWKMEKANLGKAGAYVTEGRVREERKSTLWWPSLNGHFASNVQEGGLRARNEVRGALHLPQLGATPFLSCNSGGQRKEHKYMWWGCGKVCLSEGSWSQKKYDKNPRLYNEPPSYLKQQTRLANISHVSPSYWLWTNYLLTFPSSWKPA